MSVSVFLDTLRKHELDQVKKVYLNHIFSTFLIFKLFLFSSIQREFLFLIQNITFYRVFSYNKLLHFFLSSFSTHGITHLQSLAQVNLNHPNFEIIQFQTNLIKCCSYHCKIILDSV